MKPRKFIRINFGAHPNARFAVPVRHALTSHEFWRLLVELAITQKRRRAGDLLKQLRSDRLPEQYGLNVPEGFSEHPRMKKSLRGAKKPASCGRLTGSKGTTSRSRNRSVVPVRLTVRTARRFRFK